MLLNTILIFVGIFMGLSTLTLGLPAPGRRGYGHRPQNQNQRHGFRPHHRNQWNKFGGSGSVRRPPPFINTYHQKPLEYTGIRQFPSSQVIILPYQNENGQGFYRPWGQEPVPEGQKTNSTSSAINTGGRGSPKEGNGSGLTQVTQGVEPKNTPGGVPNKLIVDEAGPVLPGPSKWVQEDMNSGLVNAKEVNETDGGQLSQQGDPSEGEGSQEAGGGRVEEARPVLPGHSEWKQEEMPTDEVNGSDEGKSSTNGASGFETVDEYTDDRSAEEKISSTEGASSVDEYSEDISELIDVRGNFG